MALSVYARNGQCFHLLHVVSRRDLVELVVGINPFHCREDTVSGAKVTSECHEFTQVGKCPRYDNVKTLARMPSLGTCVCNLDVLKIELDDRLFHKRALLVTAFEQCHVGLWQRECDRYAGKPGPTADIHDSLTGEKWHNRKAVE